MQDDDSTVVTPALPVAGENLRFVLVFRVVRGRVLEMGRDPMKVANVQAELEKRVGVYGAGTRRSSIKSVLASGSLSDEPSQEEVMAPGAKGIASAGYDSVHYQSTEVEGDPFIRDEVVVLTDFDFESSKEKDKVALASIRNQVGSPRPYFLHFRKICDGCCCCAPSSTKQVFWLEVGTFPFVPLNTSFLEHQSSLLRW